MFNCEAVITMGAPQRCLLRLCKHWSHKFQVNFDERQGNIDFGDSGCELQVTEGGLRARLWVADRAELQGLQEVVTEHLQRMVTEPLQVDWSC